MEFARVKSKTVIIATLAIYNR